MKTLILPEVLIIGPIPPFLKASHLAANPGAVRGMMEGEEELEGGGHVPGGRGDDLVHES